MDSTAAEELAGTKYQPLRLLGRGAIGKVYLAEHVVLGKHFVVKLIHEPAASRPDLVDRMRGEAQGLAALEHPNIVRVTDFGRTAAGRPYIVMEALRGSTLGAALRHRGPFRVYEAVDITRQLLSGFAAAHGIGLVHRDIKLENLFLHEEAGGRRLLKILDFGVAKVLGGVSEKLRSLRCCRPPKERSWALPAMPPPNRRGDRAWTLARICTQPVWCSTRC